MIQAIEKRKSQRTFTKEAIAEDKIQKIKELIDDINKNSELNISFVEDGSEAFSDIRTSYGFFKNVRSMILMKGNPDLSHFREKVGYYGEKLVLSAVDMGLGTCWVGGTFDRKKLDTPEGECIIAAIVVGMVDKPAIKDKILKALFTGKRKPVSERLTSDSQVPEWVEKGMKCVLLAPSALNKQKPHFEYKSGVLTAGVINDYIADLTDLGIAKLHFEIGADGGKFEFGNGARYNR